MRDVVSNVGSFYTGLASLPVIKTTQTSPSVDLSGFDGAMVYLLTKTWTDGTLTPVVQESDDNVTFTAVANIDLVLWQATSASDHTPVRIGNAQPSAISSAATAINQRVGYLGNKRYIRLVTTVTGSPSTGCEFDAVILAGRPRVAPSAV